MKANDRSRLLSGTDMFLK